MLNNKSGPEDIPEEMKLREVLLGKPTRLASRFRLTFNMILNLLRQEGFFFSFFFCFFSFLNFYF